MACMCGSLGCPSCGPAQGAPSCEWSMTRCGDPECWCVEDSVMHDYVQEDGLAEQLAEEALLAVEKVPE